MNENVKNWSCSDRGIQCWKIQWYDWCRWISVNQSNIHNV